jgi:hypothetical protein
MLYILEDTVGRNDVLFPRCSAYLYESAYGYDVHTNCQDIQAEAQREYGLTPDDVHDSFNLFMCTEVTLDGAATITRQDSKPGDYVEFLALMDVLAVPNVCGADIMRTSNFSAHAEGLPQPHHPGRTGTTERPVLCAGVRQRAPGSGGSCGRTLGRRDGAASGGQARPLRRR